MTARCLQPPTGPAAEAAAITCATVPVLETERLRLRAPRVADLPLWLPLYSGPEAVHMGGPFEDPDATAWEEFAYYTGAWMLYGHGLWTVELGETGQAIGFVHLAIEWDDREPELGWHIAPDHRGKGYATEAARAARDWGFGLLPGFVSYVDPGNLASNGVAERLGATRDHAAEAELDASGDGPVHVWRHTAPGAESLQ
jgi:RimJ/RimL family protein N-acetyltransferase